MKTLKTAFAAIALTATIAAPASAHNHHGRTIVATAAASDQFETLVAAVQTAELVDTLNSDGPFTVFAPTDAAFAKLPDGTVNALLQPANRATLSSILTYHVVAGKFDAADIISLVQRQGGSAALDTVQGGKLTASLVGDELILTDEKNNRIAVTKANVNTTNGVIHVIDGVLMP